MMSNLMAILLQALSLKLGIATGRDLAQACRDHYSKPVSFCLWVICEIAIAACDLAEVIGSAIGLQLLTGRGVPGEGIPLVWGCIITALDVLAVLYLQHKGFRLIEAIVIMLIATIGLCFASELFFSKPNLGAVLGGVVPSASILTHPGMLYVAIGIIGATVMPHNLYLHSALVQSRKLQQDAHSMRKAIQFNTIDSTLALSVAFFVNAAILVLAAIVFFGKGSVSVAGGQVIAFNAQSDWIRVAYLTLAPLLGTSLASTLFAVALLAVWIPAGRARSRRATGRRS
jgi:manganese transport protein